MAMVSDICQFLEQFAPLQLAESWDNVGLLVGRAGRPVHSLMTCLTLTLSVAQEAIDTKCQMIVTHHPLLFRGTKKITDQSEEGRILLLLAESGIAVYSPHTAFDSAAEGINQQLAVAMGLQNITPLRPNDPLSLVGAGRSGTFDTPVERAELLHLVQGTVGATYLEYTWQEERAATHIAIACGSAAEFLSDAFRRGCDTFITGEARFHSVLECQQLGMHLILTGHFCSERPAVEKLATLIGNAFPEIRSSASAMDRNPLKLHRS